MIEVTKNIVFDWNGTLLEDTDAIHACLNIILERVGHKTIDIETYRDHYDVPFERFYKNFGLTDYEIEALELHKNNFFHDHYEPRAAVAELREGAAAILNHAHHNHVQSLILSNHLVEPIRTQLRRHAIEDMFTDVLAYADRATQFRDMTKGERLRQFMVRHELKPDQTIIVGDSIEEINIAHEQGLIGVAITGGCVSEQRLQAAKPDYLIHSLYDLQPILVERGFAT